MKNYRGGGQSRLFFALGWDVGIKKYSLKELVFSTDQSREPDFYFIRHHSSLAVSNRYVHIHSLTGLRGYSALWVVLFHTCYGASNGYLPGFSEKLDWGILRNVIIQGPYAVDIFFILSGYILTHVHGRDFEKIPSMDDVKRFLLLRLARVYPLHVAMVILLGGAYAIGIWDQKVIELKDAVLSITLMNAWSDPSINTPAWSVSAEWMAYLLFPLMIPLLVRLKNSIWQFMGIMVLSIAYPVCVMVFDWTWSWHFEWIAIFRVLNGFLLGCLLYYFQEHCLFVKNSSQSDVWCFGLLLLLMSCLMVEAPIICIYGLFPWLILTLAHAQQGIRKTFSHKVSIWLGTVSFAIYMVHYPVLEVFRFGLNEHYASLVPMNSQSALWMHLGFILFSIIVVAFGWYWGVEKPCRDYFKKRWGNGGRVHSPLVGQETSRVVTLGRIS